MVIFSILVLSVIQLFLAIAIRWTFLIFLEECNNTDYDSYAGTYFLLTMVLVAIYSLVMLLIINWGVPLALS